MKQEKTTGLAVSQQTANYVEALRTLNVAASSFVNALWEHYGETQGNEMYRREAAGLFDQIQNKIAEYMAISIVEEPTNGNII